MTEPSAAVSAPRHFAVVPAGGSGSRLGADRPKQYLPLGDATLLERTVDALLACPWIERVLVVVAPGDAIAAALPGLAHARCAIVAAGGPSRRDSVLGGLLALGDRFGAADRDWIWVHDAARPGVEAASLAALREALESEPVGALLALPVADTVKRGTTGAGDEADRVAATVPRDGLWLAQTPQVFPLGALREAYRRDAGATDEASAIEAAGGRPRLVAGTRRNFKVTTIDDLHAMRGALPGATMPPADRSPADRGPAPHAGATGSPDAVPAATGGFRIGQGWDVHALVPGRPLVIGGVRIPFERGLLGHSDADVLLHAITDALLGAAALGDIGRHFPDTDARFAGADSRVLLGEAAARVRTVGWCPENVDATVVAQAPKLAPHVPAMVACIAQTLGIPTDRVNVKAKTAERLGPEGRGEGISAQAAVLLVRDTGARR